MCGSVKRNLGSHPISATSASLVLVSEVLYESGSLSVALTSRDWNKRLTKVPSSCDNHKEIYNGVSFTHVQGYL